MNLTLVTKHCIATTLLAVLSSSLFLACAPKNGSSGNPNTPAAQSPTGDGTSDSGGGTGINGKVFESYAVDPTQLLAFKSHLKPFFDRVKERERTETNETKKGKPGDLFPNVMKTLTWYIAPLDLGKVSKDSLGLKFMKSDTEQFARQSFKEVWIEKAAWDKKSEQDQADLLWHELAMTLYFLHYQSQEEICNKSKMLGFEETGMCSPSEIARIDRMHPPLKLPSTGLSDQDNINIRRVTAWFIENQNSTVEMSRILQVLLANGYKWIWIEAKYSSEKWDAQSMPSSRALPKANFMSLMKAFQSAGQFPDRCKSLGSSHEKACQIRITEADLLYDSKPVSGARIEVQVEGEPLVTFNVMLEHEVMIHPGRDHTGELFYTWNFRSYSAATKVGDPSFSGTIQLKSGHLPDSPLSLASIFIVTDIVSTTSSTAAHGSKCDGVRKTGPNLIDNAMIAIRSRLSGKSYLEMLGIDLANALSGPPICFEHNIVK